MKVFSRRRFLVAGALLGSVGVYSYRRGLRYPRLSFEHRELAASLNTPAANFRFRDVITVGESPLELRAIAPEPSISIQTERGSIVFTLNNVANNAVLETEGRGIKLIDEEVSGITRTVTIESAIQQEITLRWRLPVEDGFNFAVMGDTGGGKELAWTLKRANQLGAQFLLHLGDFNYSDGEYSQAIDKFKHAQLPCYITIGNHDFHHSGLIYQQFLNELGPMNHSFKLAGTRFTNIDTAADFWPAQSGRRGALLKQLHEDTTTEHEHIFYTHRPLKDPRPHDDHEIGGLNEIDWLSKTLKSLNSKTLLTGHVHHSAELDFEGIHQFTIGEGLGHENLVLQRPVAQLMMARIEPGKKMQQRWVDLNIPWSELMSPTHEVKLKRDGRLKQLEWYRQLIAEQTTSTKRTAT